MTGPGLSATERAVLVELAERAGAPPVALAGALDTDLKSVLDTTAALQERGLLARRGFQECRLADRGRSRAAEIGG